jgi:hypothetical protein
MRFFFFGLLSDRDVLELVLGRAIRDQPLGRARLPGHKLVTLRGDTFPVLAPDPGSDVDGLLVEWLSAADLDRIHFYESVEYEPAAVEVERADGSRVQARAFVGSARAAVRDAREWRLEDWRVRHKAKDLREGALWMALQGRLSVEEADRLWDEALAEGRALEDLVAEVRKRTVGAQG